MRCACAAGLDPTDPSNMPRLWHKGEDFEKSGTNVPLLFRMATVADVKPPKGTRVSRYLWKQPSARKVRARASVCLTANHRYRDALHFSLENGCQPQRQRCFALFPGEWRSRKTSMVDVLLHGFFAKENA